MKLFGHKSEALFDWWSLGHAVLYFGITEFYLEQFSIELALLVCIILGYFWEYIERNLEEAKWLTSRGYFSVKESWHNRYIGDMASDLIGFFVAYYWF